jgi:hypothetical protein
MIRHLPIAVLGIGLAIGAVAVHAQDKPMTHHATGSFEVKITPEASDTSTGQAMPTARMGLDKQFSGGLTGHAKGTMLSAGAPKPGSAAAYVAIDQFTGTLDGKAGGFLLVHRGFMTKAGGGDLDVTIAPDSGTGALEGISGSLKIEIKDGKHLYDLTYSLPGRP